nr:DUF3846 domain-containing protein [Butyricicoccus sp. AF86-03b2A]
MKAIRKKPGCEPEVIDIDNTLAALQQEVEGYIEVITLPYGAAIICNEEGRILGLPDNCRFYGVDFVGTVLIVGVNGPELCDVPAFFKRMVQHG